MQILPVVEYKRHEVEGGRQQVGATHDPRHLDNDKLTVRMAKYTTMFVTMCK